MFQDRDSLLTLLEKTDQKQYPESIQSFFSIILRIQIEKIYLQFWRWTTVKQKVILDVSKTGQNLRNSVLEDWNEKKNNREKDHFASPTVQHSLNLLKHIIN